jgi:hypothetical protein
LVQAFSCYRDAALLLEGITDKFRYDFVDPDPGGAFYRVPNYVSEEHAPKASAWVQPETAAGIYAPITKAIACGFCGSWYFFNIFFNTKCYTGSIGLFYSP